MDVKQCPYCGEEVLAVAKKCKHCGEWLENTTVKQKKMTTCPFCAEEIEDRMEICPVCKTPIVQKQECIITERPSSGNLPNYWLLSILCYVAVVFELIYAMHASGIVSVLEKYGMDLKSRNDTVILLGMIAKYIPEWLTLICCGVLWVFLMLELRKHYKTSCPDKPVAFITLICLSIGMYSFALILTFTEDIDIPIPITLIGFLLAISVSIFEFIVGYNLKKNLKEKGAVWVSIAMMVMAVVDPIIAIVGFFPKEEDISLVTIIGAAPIVIFYGALQQFFKKREEENKSLSE